MSEAIVPKPGSSMQRVALDAERLGLKIELKVMDQSTRTAEEAATACGCEVGQIVKSLVFENADTGKLVLLLVSGDRNADLNYLSERYKLKLKRCDVAPIGHAAPIATYLDQSLLRHGTVWAAAGRPDSVFSVDPKALAAAIDPTIVAVKG